MEEEGLFSHKDEILFLLGLLSLALFSGMVGNIISTFIVTFVIVLVVSLIHALIKIEAFNKDFLRKTLENMYILLFSIFVTTFFAVILPYLILPSKFLNIFVLQYIYLFPLLFIFFICLYLFEYLFEGKTIRHHHMIGLSLVLTITISLIITVIIIAGINYNYDITINNLDIRTQNMISQFKEDTSESHPALLIFNEIKSHRDRIINNQQKERKSFAEIDESRGLCVRTDCLKIMFERHFLLLTQTMDMQITGGMLKNAYAEHEFINKKEYLNEFKSLEEYKDSLKNKLDWYLPQENDQQQEVIGMIESDFSYDLYQYNLKQALLRNNQEGLVIESGMGDFLVTELLDDNSLLGNSLLGNSLLGNSLLGNSLLGNSLLGNSLNRVIDHSEPFKEVIRFVIKTQIFLQDTVDSPVMFDNLYGNRYVEESIESEVIRYKLLTDWMNKDK